MPNEEKGGLSGLAKQVTEEELTQRRKAATNPIPQSTPESSFCIVQDHVLKRRERVILNVYNLTDINKYLGCCGLAIHHSSIEVYGVEYAFGGHASAASGVFETKPFYQLIEDGVLPDTLSLKEQHHVGITKKTPLEIAAVVEKLAPAWPGNQYDLLRRNCNHFAAELAEAISGGKFNFPRYVNRIARVGASISCCLPASIRRTEWPEDEYIFYGKGKRLGSAIDDYGTSRQDARQPSHGAEAGKAGHAATAARESEYHAASCEREADLLDDVARLPCSENVRSYAALAAMQRYQRSQTKAHRGQGVFNVHLLARGGIQRATRTAGMKSESSDTQHLLSAAAAALPQQMTMAASTSAAKVNGNGAQARPGSMSPSSPHATIRNTPRRRTPFGLGLPDEGDTGEKPHLPASTVAHPPAVADALLLEDGAGGDAPGQGVARREEEGAGGEEAGDASPAARGNRGGSGVGGGEENGLGSP